MISAGETVRLALRALRRNKLRSFLTGLGIIIGVAAVICMVSIGEGAKGRIRTQIESTGTNVVLLFSGSSSSGGMRGGMGSQPTITWDDVRAVQTEVPAVRAAAPLSRTSTQAISEGGTWTTTVYGTTPEYFLIRNWAVVRGSGLTASDQAGAAKNAVIGQTVAEKLFGVGTDPIGQVVRIRNAPYIVVGLLDRKGQGGMGEDQDDAVFVPISAFQARIQGGLSQYVRGPVYVSAVSTEAIETARAQIAALLRERHRLAPDAEDDFSTVSMAEMTGTLTSATQTLTTLLASIAFVSLFVGGIGVMNIMLVSVTERTREIGIRMAVGAQPSDILAQFLIEALTLAAIGGVVGVLLGLGVAQLLSAKFGWSATARSDIIVAALLVSAGVGVGFGIYPARKAARLDPIEALRYE
ncbi:MAG: ABC transporter permease [Steroidobacteraceae bacterium]